MPEQDDLYEDAAATFGSALGRLARGYEPDADRRRDLLHDIHMALWQSLNRFDGRCSLRTWTYRGAHNIAISKIIRRRGSTPALIGHEALDAPSEVVDREPAHPLRRPRAAASRWALPPHR